MCVYVRAYVRVCVRVRVRTCVRACARTRDYATFVFIEEVLGACVRLLGVRRMLLFSVCTSAKVITFTLLHDD